MTPMPPMRAKAIAISQLGFSIGGLSVPLVVFLLQTYGWRMTAFISGVAVIVIGLTLVHGPTMASAPSVASTAARWNFRRVGLNVRNRAFPRGGRAALPVRQWRRST